MPLIEMSAEVKAAWEPYRKMEMLRRRLGSFRDLWRVLEKDFYEIESRQFAEQGAGPDGKWQPLSPKYAAWKEANYPGRRILELTGTLQDSLTKKGAAGQVRRVTATEMILGSSVKYAGYHQTGTGRMPRRMVVDLSPDDLRRWDDLAHEWAARTVDVVLHGAGG